MAEKVASPVLGMDEVWVGVGLRGLLGLLTLCLVMYMHQFDRFIQMFHCAILKICISLFPGHIPAQSNEAHYTDA